jgi:glycosyltransferase involved in cell wall biosynthesis
VRVGIDGRSLVGPRRGVARYTAALARALARAHPDDEWRILVPGREPVAWLDGASEPNLAVVRHPLPGRPLYGSAALLGRPRLDRVLGGGLDVFWAPAPAPLALSRGVPLVLTVHDLSFALRPRDFTAYERAWHRIARPRRLAARAARTIAVSAATREAVLTAWRLDPAAVTTIPLGITPPAAVSDERDIAAVRERHGLPDRYLLAVGALEPRKAPELLARAHARARAEGLDAALAFAGEGRLAGALNGRPGVHVLGHVPARDLDALYAGALAITMPSWLEGFGLPPLEGLLRGTPAIVSDLPVFRETLGDGALRVPPGDEGALAGALIEIASDEGLRARLVATGQAAIAGLTWERCARETRAVLAKAARL